jgi:DNA-binding MarR family transcriptional regulator
MAAKNNAQEQVYELMSEIRKFTRSSLLLQHVIAQRIGLHVTDAECIDFLQEMGPSSAGELAKATRLTTGAVTSVIDRLEKAGFVKRGLHPTDRRKVIVSFIPEKHTEAKLHYKALAKEVQQLFSQYSLQELKLIIQHTKALSQIYQGQVSKIEKS